MIFVIKRCKDCPFCYSGENGPECSVSTPIKGRPIFEEDSPRPSWCILSREQVIVRQFG